MQSNLQETNQKVKMDAPLNCLFPAVAHLYNERMEPADNMLILYDGNCPICCNTVQFLKQKDRHNKLTFADINDPAALPPDLPIPPEELRRQIYAQLTNGKLIRGMEVIRAAYRQIGLGWLIAPTGWPLLRPLFDLLYRTVAKYRYKISRLFKQ